MFQRFSSLAAAAPGMPAIIEATSGKITTRGELLARAHAIASGIREGELIPLQMPNSVDFVATILAVMQQRAVVMLIDRDASDSEVARITAHFGRHPKLPQAARVIKLTSGSTGAPRGIVTTEENLAADCENICRSMGIGPDDVNFGAIPLSHSYGFSNLVTPLIAQGTTLVISNSYLPQTIVDFCNRYQCTILPGIPMMFDHLSSTDRADGGFETVRTFISAGAPLPSPTSRRFRERFGKSIHSFYGCSECGGITYDREGAAVERGTVGRAMDGVTLSMRGSRLVVHSVAAAHGYLHDASNFEPLEPGKFVTDDLAEMRDGEVALIGRVSDLINIAGKKVNPREVEQIILQIEGVRQVKVYGEPAGARGDVVAAAIVANAGVTRETVRAFCQERLSSHKIPRIVKLIDSMPVDDRGKITRSALAEL
ncbi:MAG: acyl--CoA ligase [Acidobacteriota bacterium]|nr:acyl--CoA ligase [Acidobacteriota bacterium]